MNEKAIFTVKNMSKVFGKNPNTMVYALKNINLNIKRGEFTALVGPSGSGKSTLLNIMSGLDVPTSGEVLLLDENIGNMSGKRLADFRRDHIGFIFQSYNLIPVLTVKENIEYILVLQGCDSKTREAKVKEILELMKLPGFEKRFPSELSGGQQQRVAVARAMVAGPDIILADEPTANLDSHAGEELVNMMYSLNERFQTTFVFSTHDQMIMKKAKRLITLKDGEIESDSSL